MVKRKRNKPFAHNLLHILLKLFSLTASVIKAAGSHSNNFLVLCIFMFQIASNREIHEQRRLKTKVATKFNLVLRELTRNFHTCAISSILTLIRDSCDSTPCFYIMTCLYPPVPSQNIKVDVGQRNIDLF